MDTVVKVINQTNFFCPDKYTFIMIWRVMFEFEYLDTSEFCLEHDYIWRVGPRPAFCVRSLPVSLPRYQVWTCWLICPGCVFPTQKATLCTHLGPRPMGM